MAEPLIDLDRVSVQPSRAWLRTRRSRIVVGAALTGALAVGGLSVARITAAAEPPFIPRPPVVSILVAGDVAKTDGFVRFDDGATVRLYSGDQAHTTIPEYHEPVRAATVSVVGGPGGAECAIQVDGATVQREAAGPGELATCFWVVDTRQTATILLERWSSQTGSGGTHEVKLWSTTTGWAVEVIGFGDTTPSQWHPFADEGDARSFLAAKAVGLERTA